MDNQDRMLRNIRNILLILLIVVVFVVLKELSQLLLPLALAGLVTLLNLPLVGFLSRRRLPRPLITLLVAIITIGVLWLVLTMIGGTVQQIISDRNFLATQFTRKIDASIAWLGETIPGLEVEFLRTQVNTVLSPSSIAGLIGGVLGTLGNLGSSSLIFLIYYVILLSGAAGYQAYIEYVAGADESGSTRQLWTQTEESISAYMGIKSLISLATGLFAGLVCWIFGLEYALFWGFLGFVLNFIPSIGSILATALPVFMAIIQFNSVGLIVALGIMLGLSQFLIGSVIDPMIMGNRLRLNTVTVIFGLMFWGYIWGIPGMLLSVPLMVVMRLLLERSEDLSIMARIMGSAPKSHTDRVPLYTRIVNKARETTSGDEKPSRRRNRDKAGGRSERHAGE